MKFIKVQQNIFIIIFWDIGFFGHPEVILYTLLFYRNMKKKISLYAGNSLNYLPYYFFNNLKRIKEKLNRYKDNQQVITLFN